MAARATWRSSTGFLTALGPCLSRRHDKRHPSHHGSCHRHRLLRCTTSHRYRRARSRDHRRARPTRPSPARPTHHPPQRPSPCQTAELWPAAVPTAGRCSYCIGTSSTAAVAAFKGSATWCEAGATTWSASTNSTESLYVETRPVWLASAARAADGPGLAEARGSLRHALALKAASGEPAGRSLCHLGFRHRHQRGSPQPARSRVGRSARPHTVGPTACTVSPAQAHHRLSVAGLGQALLPNPAVA